MLQGTVLPVVAKQPIHHQQRRQQRGDPHHARRNLRQQLWRGADAERKQGDDDQKEPERIEDLRPAAPRQAQFPGQQRSHHCPPPASPPRRRVRNGQRSGRSG